MGSLLTTLLLPPIRKGAGDHWVTINGNRVLVGADGEVKSGHPLGGGASIEFRPSARMQRAIDSAFHTGQKEQAIADKSEQVLSKSLGVPRTQNNSAFDLRNDDVGIEIKTLVGGKNEKITMSKAALGRKLSEQRAEGLKGYTVVAHRRTGGLKGNATYYVKEGFGSFRLGSMTKVSLSELKEIVHR